MAVPTQVDEIGVRFTTAAFHGKRQKNHDRSLVSFVCDRQNLNMLFPDISGTGLSDKQGYDLAIECLRRFWSTDRMCTAIVTNISMDKEERYLVHPVLEGAVTAGYGTGRGVPAFHCVLQDGYFLALAFESGSWPDSGSEQIVLAGPVYIQVPPAPGEVLDKTRPPKAFPSEVLDALSSLKSKRLFVSRKVENWFAFLDWNTDIAYQRQVGCHYDSVEIDKSTQSLRFNVSASREQWKKIKVMRSFPVSAVPVSASKDPEHWVPVVCNSRGLSLGELSVPKKQLSRMLNQNSDGQLSCTLEIYPDVEMWEKCFDRIHEEGFLVSEIYSNLVPLQRQKAALDKLVKGEYVNPYLPDFLFDATKARIPDAPVLGLEPADAEYLFDKLEAHELNDEQRIALAKLRACPDVAFMQAGSGTSR